jgi:hypothetical protein
MFKNSNSDLFVVVKLGFQNIGVCSDNIFYDCMDNIEAHSGDFAVCNMCMCKEYRSYGGTQSCAGHPVLFECYMSEDHCETKLRQIWLIIFCAVAAFECIVVGLFVYKLCMHRRHKMQRISPYEV